MTETSGKMIDKYMLNKDIYGSLLATALPQVIETEDECVRAEQIVTRLLKKGSSLSPEEDKLLDLVSDLIEAYEDKIYIVSKAEPNQILRSLIAENDLKQNDLLPIFGSSGIASEVINGKRGISKAQAKKLAEYFKVSVELFI